MSKLLCLCGHMIVDQSDYLPYKADLISDQDNEIFFQSVVNAIEKFIKSWKQGTLSELYDDEFVEVYVKEGKVGDYINDVIAAGYAAYSRTIYECEQCGRIWIQSKDKNEQFFPYWPEEDERGILRSIRKDTENNEG